MWLNIDLIKEYKQNVVLLQIKQLCISLGKPELELRYIIIKIYIRYIKVKTIVNNIQIILLAL